MKRILLLFGIISCWVSTVTNSTMPLITRSERKNGPGRIFLNPLLSGRFSLGLMVALMLSLGTQQVRAQDYNVTLAEACIAVSGGAVSFSFANPPAASGDGTVTFYYRGDLNGTPTNPEQFEFFDENNNLLGTSTFQTTQCSPIQDSSKYTVTAADINAWIANGSIDFTADADATVSATLGACASFGGSCAQVKLQYPTITGPDDAGVSASAAVGAICPGSNPIDVTIKNFGTNQIDSVIVNWSVDGVLQTPVTYSATVLDTFGGTGSTDAVVNLGNINFAIGVTYNLKAWTSMPNNVADTSNLNDTLVTTLSLLTNPTNLAVSNIGSSTADVSWNAIAGTNYRIIHGATGFDPATGGTVVLNANSSPYTLTNLPANSTNDVYILADCGSGSFSDTTGPVTFTTTCVIFVAPFSENFDGPSWFASGNNANNTISQCWTSNPPVTNGGEPFKWIPRSTGPTSGNGPTTDVTGGNFMYCEASGSGAGDVATLTSPPIDVSALTTPALYFFQHRFSGPATIADMEIEVSNDNATTWTNVYSVTGDLQTAIGDPYLYEFINLGAYTGDTIQIRFTQNGNGCCGDAAIDSIVVDEAPICPWPTGVSITFLTDSSAVVSWNDPSGSSWDLEWGPTGFTQGTGSTMNTSNNPDTLYNLFANSTYDVYIRTNCNGAGNGTSIWVGPTTFTTLCSGFNAPYTNNFDAATTFTGPPVCWDSQLSSNNGSVNVVTNTFGAPGPVSAPNMLQIANGFSFTDTIAAVSPRLLNLDDGNHQIRFQAARDAVVTDLYIAMGTDPGNAATFTIVDTIDDLLNTAHTLYQITIDKPSMIGQGEYIAFVHGNGGTFSEIVMDDFVFELIPQCSPSLSSVTNWVTGSSGDVSWSPGGGVGWNIEWGATGYTQGSGLGTAQDNDTNYTITGLASNTVYDYYIQDSCSDGSLSTWSGPFSFMTDCATPSPVVLPWTEDFESYSTTHQVATNWCNSDHSLNYMNTDPNGRLRFNAGTGFYNNNSAAAATLDRSQFGNVSANFLTFTFNLSSYTATPGIVLEFYYMHHGQETHLEDRVWVRGTSSDPWIQIYNLNTNQGGTGNYNHVTNLNIVPALTAAGQSVSTTTQIRFGQAGQNLAFSTFFTDGYTFDDISLTAVNCPAPTGLSANGILDTSANFTWLGSTGVNSYDVWFGPQGFYQGSTTIGGSMVNSSTNSYQVDTLSSNTCYEYVVRAICANGDTSAWVGPYVFCTPCSPFFATYSENFDSQPTFQVPDCWAELFVGANAANADVEIVPFGTQNSAPNHMEIYNWFLNDSIIAASPLFGDMNAGDKRVTFYASQSFGAGATLIIGTLADQGKAGSFVPLDTFTLTGTHQKFIVPITTANGYNGTHNYLGFMHGQQATFQTLYVDDVIYETIPSCPEPLTGFSIAIGATTANIGWTSGGNGANWDVSVGTPGFTPSAGTLFSNDTATVTSLTPNTAYEWYVREVCGTNDTSVWTGPFSFITACLPFTAPFVEDFESHTLGWFQGADNCWTLINTNPNMTTNTNGYSWEMRNSVQTSSGGTGASGDNTLYPAIGGQFLNADVSYGTTGDSSMLISPIIDISGLSTPELEYHIHRYGTNMADFYVDIFDGTSWINGVHAYTNSVGAQTANGDPYTDTIIDLMPYLGTTNFQVRFRTVSNGCCPGDNGLDDIRISDPLTCPAPSNLAVTNIGSTTADVSWTTGGSGTSYQVSYGPSIGSPGAGTLVSVPGTSHTLTSLSANTFYNYYVREICGPGDTSFWAGPLGFTTACLAVNAPFFEDFENSTLGWFQGTDNCWEIINTSVLGAQTSGYSWEMRNTVQATSGGTGASGDNTLYPAIGGQFLNADVSYGGNGDSSMLLSPIIDISSLTSPELEYHIHRYGTNMADFHVDIFDGTSWINGVHSYTNSVGAQTANADPYTDTIIDLMPYVGTTNFRVRFRTVSNGCCPGDNGLDDIRISDPVTCPLPDSLYANTITATSATIGWNAGTAGNTSFEISYGAGIGNPASGTTMAVTGTSTNLTGLTSNTNYCFFVREICAAGDTSAYKGPLCFSTLCNTITAPYSEDFESNTLGWFQDIDNCWEIINTSVLGAQTAGYSWELRNVVQATSGGTGAAGDNTLYPAIGGQFLNADVSYGSAGDSSMLVSPTIDISPLANPAVKYHVHRYGTNMANLYVDVFDGTNWINGLHAYTNLTGPQTANADPYTDTTLSLAPYAGTTNLRVRFRTVSNGCCPGDNGLDDISFFNDSTGSSCTAPAGLAATSNVGCDSIEVSWTGNASGSFLEYGASGFTPGTGAGNTAFTTSPTVLHNLTPGTSYDVYIADTCNGGNDTSALVGPITVTTASGPLPVASFTYTVSYGAGTQTVDFDASGSTGATSYSWDFGNTNTGSGVTVSEAYTNNGTVNVTLTVTNACGTDDTIVPILINIGLAENALSRSLQVYPNPARDVISVKFTTAGSEDAVIRVLELSGKEVLRVNSTDLNGKYDDQISIGDLAKGIYVLEVESGDLKAQRRVVKH